MRELAMLGLLSASAVLGQGFSHLATDGDGTTLYFSSPMRLRGTTQYLHPKIFFWDSAIGVTLYEQRASDVPYPLPPLGFAGNAFFSLIAPDVSSDSSTITITGVSFCDAGDYCLMGRDEYQTTVYVAGGHVSRAIPGSGSLSRNGRYLLLMNSATEATGAQIQVADRFQVANDGTAVFWSNGMIALASSGQSQMIQPAAPRGLSQSNPEINDAATVVVYRTGGGGASPFQLWAYSPASGSSVNLSTNVWNSRLGAAMSDDGSQIAFLNGDNRQAYIIRSDGTGLRQITDLDESVNEISLSGDGSVLFATTSSNRIVRIDTATGLYTEIVPATPALDFDTISRGGPGTITGMGFAPDTEYGELPFPTSLAGVQLIVNGAPVSLAAVSPNFDRLFRAVGPAGPGLRR